MGKLQVETIVVCISSLIWQTDSCHKISMGQTDGQATSRRFVHLELVILQPPSFFFMPGGAFEKPGSSKRFFDWQPKCGTADLES